MDRAFGLCDLGMGCPELGYVSLSELGIVAVDDMPVQRDHCFSGDYPMSVYGEVARMNGAISDDQFALAEAYRIMFACHPQRPAQLRL